MKYTLGIETSCDETSVSVVASGPAAGEILSNLVLSQTEIHKYFGGVIPELASRRHLEVLDALTTAALKKARITAKDLGLIAVTSGPGLVGALLIGLSFAKGLAYSLNVPLVAVNHIEGHLYANFMENRHITTPCIGLVVSGGHTILLEVNDIGNYRPLGQTRDDAAGEAFDKVAKLLGLGYPGGPVIDKLSRRGNPAAVKFPRAMRKHHNYDFSLSGLKTAVVYYVQGYGQYRKNNAENNAISTPDLAASFQEAVIDQLAQKTFQAVRDTGRKTIILGGGVTCNHRLRTRFTREAEKNGCQVYLPSPVLCTDNAAMIAGLGYHKFQATGPSPLDIDANPNLSI